MTNRVNKIMENQIKVGVVILREEKILLIKEWSNKRNGYFWNHVKGTFENVLDKSITACALREAKEEAGVTVELKKFINCMVKNDKNKITVYFNFTATILDGEPRLDSPSNQESRGENIKGIVLFSPEEIRKIKEEEFISDIAYQTIKNCVDDELYPLNTFKEVNIL